MSPEALTTTARSIGLGLAAVGRPAYITTGRAEALGAPEDRSVEALRTRTFELLDAAWRLGIRFIDVARSYGRAEEFLGAWLTTHPMYRSELTISSKWGYEYVGAWKVDAAVHEKKEHSLSMFERQWPETQRILGSLPDIYLVHSVTPDSPALRDPGLLSRLGRLADDGVRVGLSTSGPHQAATIDAALSLAGSPYTVVQATWNLFERSADEALERAAERGWRVIVKEAMANGRLAPGQTASVDAAATAIGLDADALAIGCALARPWAHIVLSGAVTSAQLVSNLHARPLPSVPRAFEHPEMPADRYWSDRGMRAWE